MSDIISKLIEQEAYRQNEGLELIASENYPSTAIRDACGSILMDKYAEGYPNHRYYGGCEVVDQVEQLAIDSVCKLFNCNHANVQPHSGSQANAAMYHALARILNLDRKVKILTVRLDNGGHLTHGSPVSFSSEYYDFSFFPLDASGHISFEIVEEYIIKNAPDVLMTGYSAYPYKIDFAAFGALAKKYNLILIADIAHIAGLVAAGVHNSPFPFCDIVTSTTHKTLRGPRGGLILWNDDKYTKYINSAIFPWSQGGPNEAIIAGKAEMALEDSTPEFVQYAKNIVSNTKIACTTLKNLGDSCSDTDNHLFLINTLASYNLTGKEAEHKLGLAGITTNKNMIPGDELPPGITSGIRVGLAALTTRGIAPDQVRELFTLIHYYLRGEIMLEEAREVVCKISGSLKDIEKL